MLIRTTIQITIVKLADQRTASCTQMQTVLTSQNGIGFAQCALMEACLLEMAYDSYEIHSVNEVKKGFGTIYLYYLLALCKYNCAQLLFC